jgi:hypothetical protein
MYSPSNLATGMAHRKEKHLVLKHKQLNNWQIARISLSKRSYAYPKSNHALNQIIMDSKFQQLDAISPPLPLKMQRDTFPIFTKVS